MTVTDTLGRPVRDLRISVTDRCNFRCVYCMPKEVFGHDYRFLPRRELLTFEEIERVARVFVDLGVKPLAATAMNTDLKLTDASAAQVSPLWWPVPRGTAFDAVVGGAESREFLRQSRTLADDWRQRGVETRYEEVPGANHFTVVDPLSDPASAMTARCAALAARCAKVDK